MRKGKRKILLLSLPFIIIATLWGGLKKAYAQGSPYSKPFVIEDIDYDRSTGIYTYTYTIQNMIGRQIWWWGIWYNQNPQAILDDSTVNEQGFAPTDLLDCSAGWKNTAPANRMGFYLYLGPHGEQGFYSTYASDYTSNNVPNIGYYENNIFFPLYTDEEIQNALDQGKITESDLEKMWLGGNWGWTGSGANIITSYGIQTGFTGYYVIQSNLFLPGNKRFFYNTTDYWNSYYDGTQSSLVIAGFEDVAVTKRNYHKLGLTIFSPNSPVELLIEGTDLSGHDIEKSLSVEIVNGQGYQDIYLLDYGTYHVTANAPGYPPSLIDPIIINELEADQNFVLTISSGVIPCGDADGNGSIDIFDALLIAEYDAGLKQANQIPGLGKCDVDKSGSIDIFDALGIAEYDADIISNLECD